MSELTNLTELDLGDNAISDISALSELTNLTLLDLGDNAIANLSPLVTNTGLGSGDTVNVKVNPLSSVSIDTHIPTLQSRGVTVEFDNIVANVVDLPDVNLRAAIAAALGKASDDPITTSDMATLTQLEASKSNISDLTGLEHAIKLTWLILDGNSISDISSLSGLTKLGFLILDGNSISDISSLTGLTNLTWLHLGDNSISDISVLVGLTNLELLFLRNNSISDLSALVTNTELGSGDAVNVKGNPLSSVSIDTHIPVLESRGVTVEFDDIIAGVVADLPDANLRAAIAAELDKASDDPITTSDMAALTLLNASNSNISDLTGLEHAINLISLSLGNNSISDISTIEGLTNLTSLYLNSNLISNISSLARLTNLTSLYLGYNSISDISSLAGLTNLRRLNLDRNSISDISALVTNTGLGNGDMVNVKVNPLSPVSIDTHIPVLQSRGVTVDFDDIAAGVVIDLPDSNLRAAIATELGKMPDDVITTSDMAALTQLNASGSNISDLTGLEHAINLRGLSLSVNSISDISVLAGLTNLISLYLNNNSISDLSALVTNTGLGSGDTVNVEVNPLSPVSIDTHIPALQSRGVTVDFDDIVPGVVVDLPDSNLRAAIATELGKMPDDVITTSDMILLTQLNAGGSNISDLTGLEHAINLRSLSLSVNSISDISVLAELTNLTRLDLRSNSISDISAVSGLTDLRRLNLSGNSISDLSSLSGLTNLRSLDLSSNSVSDISSLGGLTNLTELSLWGNSISDLSALATNTGLGSGDTVDAKGNPLSSVSIDTHIPVLQSRGVTVDFDDIVAGVVVELLDSNLRTVIEEALDKASGDTITTSDMAVLIELSASNSNISDLTGLEHAINLRSLNLGGNSISDISSLSGLTSLTWLYLRGQLYLGPVSTCNQYRIGEWRHG